jgi:hypothetical protein
MVRARPPVRVPYCPRMYIQPLVPPDFVVPTLATPAYRLEPLTNRWVIEDFAAIIESFPHLDGLIGPPGSLPDDGAYTLEVNVIELGWHEREFRTRHSFAFAAITHDDRREVGCMYLYPSPVPGEDAVGISWARWDPDDPGADARFFQEFREWVARDWPFGLVVYPGRTVPWDQWLSAVAE